MQTRRKLNRRSFLALVSGATVAGGALTGLGAEARAGQGSDRDPGDPVGHGRRGGMTDRDPTDAAHRGRGAGGQSNGSGYSDSDPTDPSGNGRGGGAARSGYSDRDPTDPSGNGRGGSGARSSGCSDSDPTDPGGNGRNCSSGGSSSGGTGSQGNSGAYQTGRRERRYEICWVDHPSRSDQECNIQTYSDWAITWSDGRVDYDTSESVARTAEMTNRGYTARWNRMIVNDW